MKKTKEHTKIEIVRQGISSPFWLEILKPFLEKEKLRIENGILEDDELSETVSITKRDFARFAWGIVKQLIEYPNTIIEELAENPDDTPKLNFMEDE